MNKKQWNNKAVTLLVALGIGTMMLGCGGGSSDPVTNSGTDTLSLVQIDASNQQQVLAILFDSEDAIAPQLPTVGTLSDRGSLQLANAEDRQVLPNYKSLSLSSAVEPYTCSEGGSISTSVSGQVSVITYNNCQEAGTTINGQIQATFNEVAQEATYTMTDFSMKNEYMTYTTSATTATISENSMSYTTTGHITQDGNTIEFKDYGHTLSYVGSSVNISINGSIKSTCLGDWITIKTNQVLQITENDCPIAGEIEVQGANSKLGIKFSEDQSIDVFIDDALVQEYTNCHELPETAGVCGV